MASETALQFITLEVGLQPSPLQLRQLIESELHGYGRPLRWSVTSVDRVTQRAHVEAIVVVGKATAA